jgi:hypothetical protein
MSEFRSTLDVRELPESDTTRWMLLAELRYWSDIWQREIVIPAGFITDFVSFEPLKGFGVRASVLHDFLFSCDDVVMEQANRIFHEALECCGVNRLLIAAMFDAVTDFGAGHKANTYHLG